MGAGIKAKKVYISEEAHPELKMYLADRGYEICEVRRSEAVYAEVAAHPDIYMCKLGTTDDATVYHGEMNRLGFKYPANIIYNAVVCGRYFIHNLKYTDSDLLAAAHRHIPDIKEIYVPQGYAKCNMVVVDDTHIITEDAGIAKAIEKAMWKERNDIGRGRGAERKAAQESFENRRLKVLLITPKQAMLPGFPHGFIGGASGRVGDEIIFNGDITKHTDYEKIKAFIEETGLRIKYFDYPLTDIGSIIADTSSVTT